MDAPKKQRSKRVAVCLEMEWGHKRHLEAYAGVHKYADEAGWDCVTTPSAARVLNPESSFLNNWLIANALFCSIYCLIRALVLAATTSALE